ncbi:MAG TPA: HNH endonuclease signature motif containing protein, partial [Acidimicrobiales bacterium]|nr:HNH endonuclease signature motif containing protein [Acidimicrobiales bacterium]
ITRTESACPGSEAELVAVATSCDIKSLRDKARSLRLGAVDVDRLYARQRAARAVQHWTDELGMVRINAAMMPEVGVPFVNRLEAETGRVRREARRAGSTDPYAAHAADALAKMIGGEGKGHATRADVNLVCDLRAWRRGHTEGEEISAIIGSGPIPVDVAKELSRDGFLKVVLHDGVKVDTVAHLGRHISAELRTALELGSPPTFEGLVCVEPGCGRQAGLEMDHLDPVAHHGPTSFSNLKPRCWVHHQEKTERDRRAGLLKPPLKPPPGLPP